MLTLFIFVSTSLLTLFIFELLTSIDSDYVVNITTQNYLLKNNQVSVRDVQKITAQQLLVLISMKLLISQLLIIRGILIQLVG